MAPAWPSQAIEPSPRRVRRPSPLSPGWVKFLTGWFFGWPLLVFAYNPLAAPYDTLTLFIVIPGGAIWLLSCGLGCAALITMADARWPAAKIPEIVAVLPELVMYLLGSIP
jgi:hypothetical protein